MSLSWQYNNDLQLSQSCYTKTFELLITWDQGSLYALHKPFSVSIKLKNNFVTTTPFLSLACYDEMWNIDECP